MWSVIISLALVTAASARTTVVLPKTSIQAYDSTVTVEATGSITGNNINTIEGSVELEQAPFSVGVSRSSDKIVSALLGYSNQVVIARDSKQSPIVADVTANAQISDESGSGSLSVSSSSFVGTPEVSMQAAVTKAGVSNYGLGLSVGTNADIVQVNAQLTGAANQGATLQATTTLGPVSGVVTRSPSGLWDEQVGTELTILENPKVSLIGGVHRDTSNRLDYLVGILSPNIWAQTHVHNNGKVDYSLGGALSGTQDNVPYTISGNAVYLGESQSIEYAVAVNAGLFNGSMSGTLYDDYSVQLNVDLNVFVITLNVDTSGTVTYSFQVNLKDASAVLVLNESLKPTSLNGNFWNNLVNLSVTTDFQGDYDFSVQVQDQVITFTL